MPNETTMVRVPKHVLTLYREWAGRSGRSIQGLITMVLNEAATHYIEGKRAGVQQLSDELHNDVTTRGGKKK